MARSVSRRGGKAKRRGRLQAAVPRRLGGGAPVGAKPSPRGRSGGMDRPPVRCKSSPWGRSRAGPPPSFNCANAPTRGLPAGKPGKRRPFFLSVKTFPAGKVGPARAASRGRCFPPGKARSRAARPCSGECPPLGLGGRRRAMSTGARQAQTFPAGKVGGEVRRSCAAPTCAGRGGRERPAGAARRRSWSSRTAPDAALHAIRGRRPIRRRPGWRHGPSAPPRMLRMGRPVTRLSRAREKKPRTDSPSPAPASSRPARPSRIAGLAGGGGPCTCGTGESGAPAPLHLGVETVG